MSISSSFSVVGTPYGDQELLIARSAQECEICSLLWVCDPQQRHWEELIRGIVVSLFNCCYKLILFK